MQPSVIAALILAATVVMFFAPKFSNAAAATIGAICMGVFGILEMKAVFNYYTSTSCVLMIGMMIVGGGMFHTGFAGWLGNKIVRMTGTSEIGLTLIGVISGWVMSSICSGSAALMILYPIFCSISLASHVSMTKIMMPMFAGIGFGSLMSVAGSGMCSATSAILEESGQAGWSFFEPAWMGLPIAVVGTLLIVLAGRKMLPDEMVLPDQAEAGKADSIPDKLNGKMIVSAVILVATIAGMVINSKALPMYMCAAIGAMASVVTGCLNQKQMFSSISWSTIFMIGGMTAVAKGVEASGLGTVIAESIVSAVGGMASPLVLVAIVLLATGFITQFMSNNAAATLMAPIGISLAASCGADPRAFVAAALGGSLLAMLTPIATPTMAFAMEAGHYSSKDIFKWGVFMQLIPNTILCLVMIAIVWL